MSMPEDFVMVRHGQSEANIVQKLWKADPQAQAPEGFFDRHDSRMRLSGLGITQAERTGEWLHAEFPNGFDRYYTSPLARTVETAGRLALGGTWNIDDRWRERDWGEYGVLNDSEQETQFAISKRLRGQSKWYWCPPGGESLATGVRLRFEDILETMHRELDGKKVIAVTHGETMETARVVLERLLPEVWQEQERDGAYRMSNCQVLHYTRKNPETGEISKRLEWRRSVCAWGNDNSWSEGAWVKIERKKYTDNELLALVQLYPNLLSD
jgi:broad specificity phosphatase PhoE